MMRSQLAGGRLTTLGQAVMRLAEANQAERYRKQLGDGPGWPEAQRDRGLFAHPQFLGQSGKILIKD